MKKVLSVTVAALLFASLAGAVEPAKTTLSIQGMTCGGCVAAVTGPVDHVSDGTAVSAVANGHELLATVTGTGCMSTAITGCFLGVQPDALAAATSALIAFGVAGEDAAREAHGPGSFHVALYDALAALDPATLDARARTG